MSVASGSYQCTWIGDSAGGTILCSLFGLNGDLFQTYTGTVTAPDNVAPDWGNLGNDTGPILRVNLAESSADIGDGDGQTTLADSVIDSETRWFVDGEQLTFGNDGLSTNTQYFGCFRILLTHKNGPLNPASPTNALAPFGGLEVRKNLIGASLGHNLSVSCEVAVAVDNGATIIKSAAQTTVKIVKRVGDSNFCSIYCGSGESFVLEDKTGKKSVECKVRCWQGNTEATTFYRKWYLLESGAWVQKSTADTFTVGMNDIDSFGEVKVECYSDSARTKLIASDIQTVQDSSDPWILHPCPSPADGKFYASGTPEKITFTPKVADAEGNEPDGITGFTITVLDSAGNPQPINGTLNTKNIAKGGSFDLLWAIADGIKEGPLVVITANG